MTIRIEGPVKVMIVNLFPGDTAIGDFISAFDSELHRTGNPLAGTININSANELFDKMGALAQNSPPYNTILFVAHGEPGTGDLVFKDAALNKLSLEKTRPLRSWMTWPNFFPGAMLDKLVMLAPCYAGQVPNANSILRNGLASHLVTAKEGEALGAIAGGKAMAKFLNGMIDVSAQSMDESTLERCMDETEAVAEYQGVLSLWCYPGNKSYP